MYFSYNPGGEGFVFHDTEDEAMAAAKEALSAEKDFAGDGWPEDVEDICWGKVSGRAVKTMDDPAPEGSEFDRIWDFDLKEVEQ